MTQAADSGGDSRPRLARDAKGKSALSALKRKLERLRLLDGRVQATMPGSPEYEAAARDLDRLSQSLMDEFRKAGAVRRPALSRRRV